MRSMFGSSERGCSPQGPSSASMELIASGGLRPNRLGGPLLVDDQWALRERIAHEEVRAAGAGERVSVGREVAVADRPEHAIGLCTAVGDLCRRDLHRLDCPIGEVDSLDQRGGPEAGLASEQVERVLEMVELFVACSPGANA